MADLSMVCTRDIETPARARRWVTEQFDDTIDRDVIDAFHVIVTELITNAIVHGAGTIELCVAVHGRRARIEVTDQGADCDVVLVPLVADGPGGRGLRLVDSYADRWACQHTDDGKMVWAEIDLPDQRTERARRDSSTATESR